MKTKSTTSSERQLWYSVLLVALTVAAYWPVFSAGFIWDDDDYVVQNQCLHDLSGLWAIWFDPAATPQYYPLVHTTFWLEYHLWQLQPMGFHVVNVLLHSLGAILLWRVLVRLRLPGAWLAAAIFAVHPLETESVAWITERKNVLSGVFYFSAAWAYLRFSGVGEGNDRLESRWRFYYLALVLFLAALLCKTVTCSLPAALFLVVWWKKESLRWRDMVPLAPFFAVGLALGLLTAWLEKHHVGAQGAEWSLTFPERCLIAGRAIVFYATKLGCPAELVFIYPRWQVNAAVWWQWLFPVSVLLVLAGLWLARHKIGKGVLVAVLFFCVTLFPALGFINVYPMRFSFVADHFQYLAGIGLIVLAATAAARYFERRPETRRLQMVLVGVILLTLGVRTSVQCRIYQDLYTLWTDTLEKNPACWMAHTNLGRLDAQQNLLEEAERHYLTAIDLNPHEDGSRYNYGNLLMRGGHFAEAETQYRIALETAPQKAVIHNNLGFSLNKQHRTDEAIAEFQRAIQLKPNDPDAYYNLGTALMAKRQVDAAVAAYQKALQLRPDSEMFKKRLQELGVPTN